MGRYKGDPQWIDARFNGKCSKCDSPISKGERAFYYPNNRSLLGKSCGCADAASADFEAARFDEDAGGM